VRRRASVLAAAVLGAGLLHAAAGHALAATDPIGALLGGHGAGVVVAAIGVIVARLFLYFVAPGWAAHFSLTCIARALAAARSER
jgi:hypothetical protein